MRDFNNGFSKEEGLFALAGRSKVQRNFIWFAILSTIITFGAALPATFIGMFALIMLEGDAADYWNTFINLTLGFGATTFVIYLIVKFREKRSFRDLGFFKKGAFKNYIVGFATGLLLLGLITVLIVSIGGLKLKTGIPTVGLHMLPTILFLLIGWIIQGGTSRS